MLYSSGASFKLNILNNYKYTTRHISKIKATKEIQGILGPRESYLILEFYHE